VQELHDFYEAYIAAFNAQDAVTFPQFFHLPVTIMPLPVDGGDAGRDATPPVVVTDSARLWPTLPAKWTRSTIDEVRVVADMDAYTPRAGFADRGQRRPAINATVTRWAGDVPYEQVHVMYLLDRRNGHLGICAMVPLAVAAPT
jgi:hypothetical protein